MEEQEREKTCIEFAEWCCLNYYRYHTRNEFWVDDEGNQIDEKEVFQKFLLRYKI